MDRILVVDDDATLAMEFEEFLPTLGYEVVGVADCAEDAVEQARDYRPDLILMDIRLPGKMDGIEAAGIIKSELDINILFISGYADKELLERAKVIEPLGYIHKPFSEEQIAAALKVACYQINRKGAYAKISIESYSLYNGFTAAEIRITQLLKQGKTTKEISAILNLSPDTVKWHRRNIRRKLGIVNTGKDLVEVLTCGTTVSP